MPKKFPIHVKMWSPLNHILINVENLQTVSFSYVLPVFRRILYYHQIQQSEHYCVATKHVISATTNSIHRHSTSCKSYLLVAFLYVPFVMDQACSIIASKLLDSIGRRWQFKWAPKFQLVSIPIKINLAQPSK